MQGAKALVPKLAPPLAHTRVPAQGRLERGVSPAPSLPVPEAPAGSHRRLWEGTRQLPLSQGNPAKAQSLRTVLGSFSRSRGPDWLGMCSAPLWAALSSPIGNPKRGFVTQGSAMQLQLIPAPLPIQLIHPGIGSLTSQPCSVAKSWDHEQTPSCHWASVKTGSEEGPLLRTGVRMSETVHVSGLCDGSRGSAHVAALEGNPVPSVSTPGPQLPVPSAPRK